MMDFGFYNMDCIEGMKQFPDNYFDLAIVDPPYGKGTALTNGGSGRGWNKIINGGSEKWDFVPDEEYFVELFRVSKNQIIWGGNYFNLPPTLLPLCWDKMRPNQKNVSEWEYAWTSFDGRARKFTFCANGGFIMSEPRIHPTQKPIELYRWLIKLFYKQGHKVLDTHVGSASSLIAFEKDYIDYVGFELIEHHFNDATRRLKKARETTIDMFKPTKICQQQTLKY